MDIAQQKPFIAGKRLSPISERLCPRVAHVADAAPQGWPLPVAIMRHPSAWSRAPAGVIGRRPAFRVCTWCARPERVLGMPRKDATSLKQRNLLGSFGFKTPLRRALPTLHAYRAGRRREHPLLRCTTLPLALDIPPAAPREPLSSQL